MLVLMVARYILLRLKTLNSRNFRCVSRPLVFYITEITTYNLIRFVYVIHVVACIYGTISPHL